MGAAMLMSGWSGRLRLLSVCSLGTLLWLASLTGCTSQRADGDRIIVVTTILPLAGFIEAVGGDRVEAVVMVPPGASPHTYEVTPAQMVLVSRAAMYAAVGTPVEFELAWMDKLAASNPDMLVVDCSVGIELMYAGQEVDHGEDVPDGAGEVHEHEGTDPHIWLSVKNAQVMVSHICDGLVEVDPQNTDHYRANCAAYLKDLSALDQELQRALEALEVRQFVVFHPAFGYLARDYDLEQIPVEKGGNEPDAAYIIRVIEEAKENGIRVVFAAPQFSTRSAEIIADEIGGEVVLIDSLPKDYIGNMRMIAAALTAGA